MQSSALQQLYIQFKTLTYITLSSIRLGVILSGSFDSNGKPSQVGGGNLGNKLKCSVSVGLSVLIQYLSVKSNKWIESRQG